MGKVTSSVKRRDRSQTKGETLRRPRGVRVRAEAGPSQAS